MDPVKKKKLKEILSRLHMMYHQRRACQFDGVKVHECTCNLKFNNQLIKQAVDLLEEDDVIAGGTGRTGCGGQGDAKQAPRKPTAR